MEKTTAAERARSQPEELTAPAAWTAAQPQLAARTGLAVLLVAGHQPPQLSIVNNNSICHTFQSSPAHAHLCDPYCGEAFKRAQEAGTVTHYRCHAGLHCFTMPVDLGAAQPLAVIGGRAFQTGADYRTLVDRFRVGDLRLLNAPEVFHNIILATHADLDELAARVASLATEIRSQGATQGETDQLALLPDDDPNDGKAERAAATLFPPHAKLRDAARIAAQAVGDSQRLKSVAVLLRTEHGFTPLHAAGKFTPAALDLDLNQAAGKTQKQTGGEQLSSLLDGQLLVVGGTQVEMFPLVVNDEVKGAVLVGDVPLAAEKRTAIASFCRKIAMPLEVLRLREELEQRMRAAYHLQAFIEQISKAEPGDPYQTILRHCVELLRSERGSLMLFDETANELQVKAAVGPRAQFAQEARVRMTDSVAGSVWRAGRPLVVRDLTTTGHHPAPAERKYKSNSFICYPIQLGGRKVGVLNMTDKTGDGVYDELDLSLLDLLVPQMALALDRAEWHQKATQFQLLSITDALTGLVNRRYLEERLSEELERSKRHRFAMSFLMIDIDNFKDYNDRHGHPAGDLALEMTAQCLKSALRSADVPARYGGEEFSVLLPQTSITEAHVIAERIRRRVERTQYPHGKAQPLGAVTISIGISSFAPRLDTPALIIAAADHALYVAKSHGKNRVEAYVPPTSADQHPDA
jgi:diguanylate cyclase (GGDEF)-like protein